MTHNGDHEANGTGAGSVADVSAAKLVALHARLRAERAEFTAGQLAALDSLARAQRVAELTADDAASIEAMIRRGQVSGARKRLTQARRAARTSPEQ